MWDEGKGERASARANGTASKAGAHSGCDKWPIKGDPFKAGTSAVNSRRNETSWARTGAPRSCLLLSVLACDKVAGEVGVMQHRHCRATRINLVAVCSVAF